MDSPVVRAARAALSYAANPADTNSALILRVLGPDPLSLQIAINAQIDGELADDAVLTRLSELSDSLARLPISQALDLVINAAGLRYWADRQTDAAQARADLLRLEAEATDFEAAHRDLKAAAGFHGESAKVFLGWLEARKGERDFDRRPDPAANSAEAVEIVTWHASKGREWPITVVAEFDDDIADRPGTTTTRFAALDQIDDMNAVLSSAMLIHSPGLAAPEAMTRFIEDRRADFEANAKNLLYVALTRARDRLVLEWPAFLKERDEDAPEADCLFHVFEDACKPQIGEDEIRLGTTVCPAVIRTPAEQAGFTEYQASEFAEMPRIGSATPMPVTTVTPWRLQPSLVKATAPTPRSQTIMLGEAWPISINDAVRGTAIHLAMRTCLTRPDLQLALPMATGLDETTLTRVATRAAELQNWLTADGYTDLRCEISLLGHTAEGAEIPGMIDLLAIGPKGCLLIDHKTGGVGEGLGAYWPQLSTYAGLVGDVFPELALRGVAIHWVDHGRLEFVDFAETSA
jgi:ATP-dependent exoDNAse (exonuclease V) beta subunit